MPDALSTIGRIDIYLLDQVVRGRISPGARLLDLGCGGGRNLEYFLREGYEVFGVDADPEAIREVRALVKTLSPALPESNFRNEPIEEISFDDAHADVVLSSAVFHFARDEAHFWAMLRASWRVLKPGGIFFCRLASTIGMADRMKRVGAGRRFTSPDGVERFLVDEALLLQATTTLGGDLLDPLKTTVVQDQRSMTTWVARKR